MGKSYFFTVYLDDNNNVNLEFTYLKYHLESVSSVKSHAIHAIMYMYIS